METEDCKYAYVGRNAEGRWVACAVDNPDHKKDTSEFCKKRILEGLTIERTTVERAREILGKTIPL